MIGECLSPSSSVYSNSHSEYGLYLTTHFLSFLLLRVYNPCRLDESIFSMPPLPAPSPRPTITIPWTHPARYDVLIRETFASVRRRFAKPYILSLVLRVQSMIQRILVRLGWTPRPRRKALLIGIKSVDQTSPVDPKVRPGHRKYASVARMKQNKDLKGPHRDVLDLAKVLQGAPRGFLLAFDFHILQTCTPTTQMTLHASSTMTIPSSSNQRSTTLCVLRRYLRALSDMDPCLSPISFSA